MNTITAIQVSRALVEHGVLIKPGVLQIYLPVPRYGGRGIRWLDEKGARDERDRGRARACKADGGRP